MNYPHNLAKLVGYDINEPENFDEQTDWLYIENVILAKKQDDGSFDCQSDYGNDTSSWNSIGNMPFIEFLLSLDYGYFMNRTRGENQQIFNR